MKTVSYHPDKLQKLQVYLRGPSSNYWAGTEFLSLVHHLLILIQILQMHRIVICDTSCLILLHKIGELDLLSKVYDSVSTTPEVVKEFLDELPIWIKIESVKDKKYQEFLETQIDLGEASAIALAMETNAALLLLDDLKARKLATKLNLNFTGTLGVIHRAKQIGVIEAVKPIIEKLQASNFRIADNIIKELLRRNNEG